MRTTNEVSKKIMEEGLHLDQGMGVRCTCPICRASHERSLSIRRTEKGLVYKCFRNSCGARGFINSKGKIIRQQGNFQEKKLSNRYEGKTYLLSDRAKEFLKRKFYLTDSVLSSFRETEEGDVMLPMRNELGIRYGWVNRRWKGLYGKDRTPKSINYYDDRSGTTLHFACSTHPIVDTISIVEDIVSAERIGKYTPCAALIGTTLRKDDAVLLRKLGVRELVIILDADANATSMKIQRQYELLFDRAISVQRPVKEPDPKDMTPRELWELLNEYA